MQWMGDSYERNISNGLDTRVVETKYYKALGRLAALRRGGVLYWVGTDHQGGTVRVANSSFNPIARMRYTPYGVSRDDPSLLPHDYLFTDQELDASVGLYWYGSRAYDASLGRFTCPDTIVPSAGNPQSLNRYSYALGNPLKYTDPSGHNPYDGQGIVELDHPDWLPAEQRQALYEHNMGISNGGGDGGGGGGDDGGGGDASGIIDVREFGIEPSYLPVEIRQALYEHNMSISGAGPDGGGTFKALSEGSGVPVMEGGSIPDGGQVPTSRRNLGWEHALAFLSDWVNETGATYRGYGPDTVETMEMRMTAGVERMRREFYAGGTRSGEGDWGWFDAAVESFANSGNGTQFQVGGYQYYYSNNGNNTVSFIIKNDAERRSFFLHVPFVEPANRGLGQWFGGGTVTQFFYWTEPIVR